MRATGSAAASTWASLPSRWVTVMPPPDALKRGWSALKVGDRIGLPGTQGPTLLHADPAWHRYMAPPPTDSASTYTPPPGAASSASILCVVAGSTGPALARPEALS